PILIKNTLNPGAPGTTVCRTVTNGHRFATGVSSLGDLTLLTLRGLNAIGAPGTAGRLFQALTSGGVNALLTSQPLGEHTISFAVRNDEAGAAVQAVTQEFRFEFQRGLTALDQKANQAIVAVIGNGVKERPNVASNMFAALGRHNITISAIAQGASERNIACVVDATQQSRAVTIIHQGLFEPRKRLALAV